MAASIQFDYEVEGVEDLLRKLDPDALLAPMRDFLESAGEIIQKTEKQRAPVESGALQGSIRYEVGGGSPPRWLKVESHVTSAKGFPYPAALNTGGQYHYRSTAFAGSATAGWWDRGLDDADWPFAALQSKFVAEIQRIWGG